MKLSQFNALHDDSQPRLAKQEWGSVKVLNQKQETVY